MAREAAEAAGGAPGSEMGSSASGGAAGAQTGSSRQRAEVRSRILRPIPLAESLPVAQEETDELAAILREADAADATVMAGGADRGRARREIKGATLEELEGFISRNPQSGWVPALREELAAEYRRGGRFTKALEHWARAWEATAEVPGETERMVADRSLVQTAAVMARLGRPDELRPLIEAHQFRVMAEPRLAQTWARTIEAYFEMANQPGKAYRCGTFALNNTSRAMTGKAFADLWRMASPPAGFTLAELVRVSEDYELGLVPAVRSAGAPFIFPAVVHWKQNHYAAITKSDGELFLIEDPTFRSRIWMEASALEEEASGYFMVPRSVQLPQGWRYATEAETKQVYGRGYPEVHDDEARRWNVRMRAARMVREVQEREAGRNRAAWRRGACRSRRSTC